MPVGARPCALGGRQRPDQRLHEGADDARRGHRRVEPRKGAAHDAIAQDALEAMRQLRAIVETHALHFRIDGLGDQGVGQPAALQGAAGEGADGGGELLDRQTVGIRYCPHDPHLACRDGCDDLRAHRRFRWPVAIDGSGRHAGLEGDTVHLGGGPALAGDEVARGLQDAGALVGQPPGRLLCPPVGHARPRVSRDLHERLNHGSLTKE